MECPITGLLKSLQAQGIHTQLLLSPELVTKQAMGWQDPGVIRQRRRVEPGTRQ